MAPIFYCSCTNCICTATVLLKQERQEDKNATEEEQREGHVGEEGHHVGVGQEYTVLMRGWERPTDAPLFPADAQESGVGSIVLVVVLLLLAIGKDSSLA